MQFNLFDRVYFFVSKWGIGAPHWRCGTVVRVNKKSITVRDNVYHYKKFRIKKINHIYLDHWFYRRFM
jgi:hypothetical protein